MPSRAVSGLFLVAFVHVISLAGACAAVDPDMVGAWEIRGETEHQPWKLTWVIRDDNSYYFEGLFSDAGTIGSGDGKWHIVSSVTGQRSEGTYTLPDRDHLNGTGPLGPGIWTRVGHAQGGASQPVATPSPLPRAEEAQLVSDFTNASHNRDARDRLEKKAQDGIASAQVLFGMELQSEKNFPEALIWYRKGAEQGEGNAMRNLGACYRDGTGVRADPSEAMTWFRKAAEAGNVDALCDIGDLYKDGEGVTKNAVTAAEWYRKGADRGDGNAMNTLAACYWDGLGLEKSPREAINWWKRAAEKGHPNASKNLQMALKKFDETGRPRTPP